ncbi:MAG: LysE family translocator [Janthinobacterium lividum]
MTFFLGVVCNFIGYVPPGNINLTLVQITINRGLRQAVYFICSFSVIEFFFTLLIMYGASWLSQQMNLSTIIDWVMVVLFTVLGFVTWRNRNEEPSQNYSDKDSIKYGIILGFLNPMQIPFWLITGTYLITHQWIEASVFELIVFSFGSALGAFLCLYIYAKSANYIKSKFALSSKVINKSIAVLFWSFAVYHIIKQIYLMFFKHH